MFAILLSTILSTINFVECEKCPYRMRISEDGKTAYINMSRIDAKNKDTMTSRAKTLLKCFSRPQSDGEKQPLMGWSSWNTFAVDISEDIIVDVAQSMATNGLKEAGYVYVNIDDGFFNGHGEDGKLKFHPIRLPYGLKGTVDRIHSLGMKAGIYSEAGANTCGSMWNNDKGGVGAGLYGHDDADTKLFFNDLQFDFIKVDYCGAQKQKLDEGKRYTEIYNAIKATGEKVRFNICRWAFPGTWVRNIAGSWRTTRDIRANWKSIRDIIKENLYLSAYASPGHYNDLDMLEVGQITGNVVSAFGKDGDIGITREEEITHFGMWCIMSSPLLLGCDVRKISSETLKLVTNPCLLAMNQNDLGLQAYVAQRQKDAYVLVKDADKLYGKARYVALFNAGEKEHRFELEFPTIDLDGTVDVFDLIKMADLGEYENRLTIDVPAHSSRFFRLDAQKRLERTVYEAECAFLTSYQELKDYKKAGTASPIEVNGASGGIAIANLGSRETNDIIWENVTVFSNANRKISIRHSAEKDYSFFMQPIQINTKQSSNKFETSTIEINLNRGTHSIRLFSPVSPMPIIDFLKIK